MKRPVPEALALSFHAFKWLLLASCVGVIVGITSTGFILILNFGIQGLSTQSWSIWLLPIGLSLSAWITSALVPEASGQGVERVIRAIHLQSGKISWHVIPAKVTATLLTIGTGGSAGNVGPCVQIGSGLSSFVADLLRFDANDRKTLVICGLSAGFASIFGTPLAGAFFGIEALFVGSLAYQVLFPSVVAALIGHLAAAYLGMPPLIMQSVTFPSFDLLFLGWTLIGGIGFGLCAWGLVECLNGGKRLTYYLPSSPPVQGLIGGLILVGLGWLVSPQILGLGTETIHQALQGEGLPGTLFLGKILTTSLTLNFGGSGGIVLPICFVGAASGSTLGLLLGQDPALFAALGLSALLAGAINTPITAVLLGLELFGLSSGPYLLLTCTMAFLLSGHRSAIPTQLLQLTKSPNVQANINQEIGEANSTLKVEQLYETEWPTTFTSTISRITARRPKEKSAPPPPTQGSDSV